MSNFKSGSGNLDFGSNSDEEAEESAKDDATPEQSQSNDDKETTASSAPGQSTTSTSDSSTSAPTSSFDEPSSNPESRGTSTDSPPTAKEYPYFIRRNNVGDERDTRLEIHVRDKVADQEATFRNELAHLLETNDISKTDAREFALLAAFQHPERVAELMRDEGFGTL